MVCSRASTSAGEGHGQIGDLVEDDDDVRSSRRDERLRRRGTVGRIVVLPSTLELIDGRLHVFEQVGDRQPSDNPKLESLGVRVEHHRAKRRGDGDLHGIPLHNARGACRTAIDHKRPAPPTSCGLSGQERGLPAETARTVSPAEARVLPEAT